MPATFPLDSMDLTMFISPIRPGIGDPETEKKEARNRRGEATCFDLSIDDVEATSGDIGRFTTLNVGLHEKKGDKNE